MGESLYQVSHRVLSRCIVWSVLTVSATCAEAVAQEPSDDSQWTFDAAVYGWLMATQGTLGLRGFDADIDNSFADTLKASDSLMAFMVHGEAWRDDIGIFLDIAYVDLGYDDIAVGPLRACLTISRPSVFKLPCAHCQLLLIDQEGSSMPSSPCN